jgi:hypothetical protein
MDKLEHQTGDRAHVRRPLSATKWDAKKILQMMKDNEATLKDEETGWFGFWQ